MTRRPVYSRYRHILPVRYRRDSRRVGFAPKVIIPKR
jgi:hypothetical protein